VRPTIRPGVKIRLGAPKLPVFGHSTLLICGNQLIKI
jgi:hypothetical protein